MNYKDYYFICNIGIYTKNLNDVVFIYPNILEFQFAKHNLRLIFNCDIHAYIEFFRLKSELLTRDKENFDFIK